MINFYETLKFEVKDEVKITIATHGWMGTEMSQGRFMVEEGAEMQWKEEREVSSSNFFHHFYMSFDANFVIINYRCKHPVVLLRNSPS